MKIPSCIQNMNEETRSEWTEAYLEFEMAFSEASKAERYLIFCNLLDMVFDKGMEFEKSGKGRR